MIEDICPHHSCLVDLVLEFLVCAAYNTVAVLSGFVVALRLDKRTGLEKRSSNTVSSIDSCLRAALEQDCN